MSKLTLKTESDKHVVVTRRFAASPEAVYRAHTDPQIIQKWLLGPEGWTMPVCIVEARPGGKIRYEWTNGKGGGFHLTGEYLELEPYTRIVHVERMHLPDPTPDNHVETRFDADGAGTLMTMRMTLPDCRDAGGDAVHGHGTRNGSELRAAGRNDLVRSGKVHGHGIRTSSALLMPLPKPPSEGSRQCASRNPHRAQSLLRKVRVS